MGCEDIIKVFFNMTAMIKLYHWQTKLYARHKATDELHSELLSLTDKFIEVYIGRYGRPKFEEGFQVKVSELTEDTASSLLRGFVDFLKNELPKYLKKSDTDLFNIRDEILGTVHQTLYLFTLS
jgi:hypothetical protein